MLRQELKQRGSVRAKNYGSTIPYGCMAAGSCLNANILERPRTGMAETLKFRGALKLREMPCNSLKWLQRVCANNARSISQATDLLCRA